jgi:hypothetical protein
MVMNDRHGQQSRSTILFEQLKLVEVLLQYTYIPELCIDGMNANEHGQAVAKQGIKHHIRENGSVFVNSITCGRRTVDTQLLVKDQ